LPWSAAHRRFYLIDAVQLTKQEARSHIQGAIWKLRTTFFRRFGLNIGVFGAIGFSVKQIVVVPQ
jgi:hypothetical protein